MWLKSFTKYMFKCLCCAIVAKIFNVHCFWVQALLCLSFFSKFIFLLAYNTEPICIGNCLSLWFFISIIIEIFQIREEIFEFHLLQITNIFCCIVIFNCAGDLGFIEDYYVYYKKERNIIGLIIIIVETIVFKLCAISFFIR